MSVKRFLVPTLLAGVVLLGACGGSSSNSSSGSKSDEGGVTASTAAATKGTPVAVEDGENADGSYFMKVAPVTVPAGPVTFTMKNTGTKEHEMVVLKTDTAADQLEVSSDHRVSEDASVGEISETAADKTATTTLDLKAGKYVLVCNIAKHYEKGMYSAFTVE